MAAPKLASSPIGAAALGGSVATIAMYLLSLWHWWAHVPTDVRAAVQAVVTYAAIYRTGYQSVVSAPGQQVTMELTPSALPTVQTVPEPAQPVTP